MMRLPPVLLVFALMGLGACPSKSPPEARTHRSAAAKPTSEVCASDADCVLTARRLKHCCLGCTAPYAVHKNRAAAIAGWHHQHCKDGTYRCPKVNCADPPGKPRARCKKRRCVTEISLGH